MRMRGSGLPVPEGFIITTEACLRYIDSARLPEGLMPEVLENLSRLEEATGRRLGDPERPLLVSVRSGAPVSMPGMMDTVLNVGLTGETVRGLARETGDAVFAWECYARLVESYARIVRGVPDDLVEDRLLELGAA